MEHEGLYRIPADQKKRMELLRHFDRFYNCGKTFSLSDLGPAPNTLAGAVQWFLSSKNLPEPVIPTELIPRLQEVMGEFYNTQVIGNKTTLSLAISPKCIGSEMRFFEMSILRTGNKPAYKANLTKYGKSLQNYVHSGKKPLRI